MLPRLSTLASTASREDLIWRRSAVCEVCAFIISPITPVPEVLTCNCAPGLFVPTPVFPFASTVIASIVAVPTWKGLREDDAAVDILAR